jgi:hypothetical protein
VRRHAAAVLLAVAAATSILGYAVSPVSAECPYLPPWPAITAAIPTARTIVVGEIVTDFTLADLDVGPGQERDFALQVTHVLRGPARPGDLLDVQYLEPNWPQTLFTGADGPTASCTWLRMAEGEVLALAFDALQPGGPMKDGDREWIQPPTRYNAVGVIKGPGGSQGTSLIRERVTLQQLRYLATLPPTDTAALTTHGASGTGLLFVAGLIGLSLAWRRFGAAKRVAPDGVRRSER